jgi:hypothetical protein
MWQFKWVWILVGVSTSAFAEHGVLLAKVTSSSSRGVMTCKVYSKVTYIHSYAGDITRRSTKYTHVVPNHRAFQTLVGRAWGNPRRQRISANRNVEIVGYDQDRESNLLYFITGEGSQSVLSHEESATGNSVFNFILGNCTGFQLPWINI